MPHVALPSHFSCHAQPDGRFSPTLKGTISGIQFKAVIFMLYPTSTDHRDAIFRDVIESPSVQEPLRLHDPH